MSADDHRPWPAGTTGWLPGRKAVLETLIPLCYFITLLTALTLLFARDLIIRL